VAVVDARSQVHFVPISIERDTGATLQVVSGLREQDRVIALANAAWTEGMRVVADETAERAPAKPSN
jgi:hypothetical protein